MADVPMNNLSLREMVLQLWTAIIGSNGGGLIKRFDKFLETREETCPVLVRMKIVDEEAEAQVAAQEKAAALRRERYRNRIMTGSLIVAAIAIIIALVK